MSEKGLLVLKSMIQYKSLIDQVISSRDKNVRQDYFNEIRELCCENSIAFYDRGEKVVVDSVFSIAISWRWMIEVHGGNKLIVLHDSLLPKYRGFAPLVNMLLNKEPKIGVTALFANKEFDCGDIIMQKSIDVHYPIRIIDAIRYISLLYVEIVSELMQKLKNGLQIYSVSQNDNEASYGLWRDEDDYAISWCEDATYIQQFIYSVGFPYLGASSYIEDVKYRVLDCEIEQDVQIENRCPGKVLFVKNGCPVVVCGKGLLRITKLETIDGKDCLPLKKYRIRFK